MMSEYSTINFLINQALSTQDKDHYVDAINLASIFNTQQPNDLLNNWLSDKGTLELIWTWEKLNNAEFCEKWHSHLTDGAGIESFVLMIVTWLDATNAKGLIIKDKGQNIWLKQELAIDFANWLSPQYRLFSIQKKLRDEQVLKCLIFDASPSFNDDKKRLNNALSNAKPYSAHYDALLNSTKLVVERDGVTEEIEPTRFNQDELFVAELLKVKNFVQKRGSNE